MNYIIVHVCKDGTEEVYHYNTEAEAAHHFALFANDDSGIYEEIRFVEYKAKEETVIRKLVFCQ